MKVILPVAGKGTRVHPHSYSKPKPFLRVAEKTAIQHLIDHVLTLNPEEFIIVVDKYNGDTVAKVLPEMYPTVKFHFVEQPKQIGTADVVIQAKKYIKRGDDLFIVFCDTIFKKDLRCLDKLKQLYDAVIFVKEVEDYQRFGVVVHKDNIMTKIVEKPSKPISKLANIGAQYVRNGYNFVKYAQRVIDEDRKLKGEWYLTEAFAIMIEEGKKIWSD